VRLFGKAVVQVAKKKMEKKKKIGEDTIPLHGSVRNIKGTASTASLVAVA